MTGTTTSHYFYASANHATNYIYPCAIIEKGCCDSTNALRHIDQNRFFKPDIDSIKKLSNGGHRTDTSDHVFSSQF